MRVIAMEFNVPMLVDVLARLDRDHGWRTVYCVSYKQEERLRQHFPEIVYHDTHDARYGRPARGFEGIHIDTVDQPTAEALAYNFLNAIKQMDRQEIMGGFSTHDRFFHLYRLVGYWSAVFDRMKPDLLLFPTAPHVVYDYVAYALARFRNIRTLMYEYVTTEGLLMAIDRFEDGLPPLTAAYQRALSAAPSQVVLSDRMETYLRRLTGDYEDAMPIVTREIRERAAAIAAEREAAARAADAARAVEVQRLRDVEQRRVERENLQAEQIAAARSLLAKHAREAERRRIETAALAERRHLESRRFSSRFLRKAFGLQRIPEAVDLAPFEPEDAYSAILMRDVPPAPQPNALAAAAEPLPPGTDGHYHGKFYAEAEVPLELARAAAAHRLAHQEELKRRYAELAVAPDLSVPYVYLPLHTQPERSTNPNGGVFDDMHLIAGILAAALPAGWRIYVKEHPTELSPQFASERGRWTTLYDELVSIEGVSLVPLDTAPFELIDKSRAVASITGTSSWEGLIRGIPAMVFGEAWYKGCPGAHTVRTLADCRAAFASIEAGERPRIDDIRLFVKVAEEHSIVGFLNIDDQPAAGIDEATNIDNLAAALVREAARERRA